MIGGSVPSWDKLKIKKYVFTASLLYTQCYWDGVKNKPASLVICFWESTCGFPRHKMVDRWPVDLDFKTVRFLCFIPAHSTWQVNKLNEAIQSNLSEPSTSEHLLIQILKNQEELKATLKVHSS